MSEEKAMAERIVDLESALATFDGMGARWNELVASRDRAWLKSHRLEAERNTLLEACENLENDNGSIPKHAWDMVQAAIAKTKVATGDFQRCLDETKGKEIP